MQLAVGPAAVLLLIAVAASSAATADKAYRSIGCYLSSAENGVLSYQSKKDAAMTHEMCRNQCFSMNRAFFGLLGGDKCFCGNSLYAPQKVDASLCDWRCGGNPNQQCGSDLGIHIFKFGQELQSATGSMLLKPENTVLLFSIKAHSGKVALKEYMRPSNSLVILPAEKLSDLYRSGHLNNLPQLIRSQNLRYIVAEMRKDRNVVAQVTFDVSQDIDRIDLTKWFSVERLASSHPYWIGKGGFSYFSIAGRDDSSYLDHHYKRSFHIMNSHNMCAGDIGFWGIAEQRKQPVECSWITVDTARGYPSLFYSRQQGVPFEKSVDYADYFVIYGAAN